MSWFPPLELGWWNAWILMLYFPLHPLIMVLVDKAVGTGEMMQKMGDVPYQAGERRAFIVMMALLVLLLLYSIFLPLKLGTLWFYLGVAIYLVGLAMFLTAIVNIATTPLGQPFTTGMYRYSRHPMVFGESLTFVGVALATTSVPFLVISAVMSVLQIYQAIAEERGCLETYGDEYQAYLQRTPRWIGMPKTSSPDA
jgi:protein-S-isoprenylcysteine O-methyltransferase Ste14